MGGVTDVCEHGGLRRKCDTCYLAGRVRALEEALTRNKVDALFARDCLLSPRGAGDAAVHVEAIEERVRKVLEGEQHG